MDQLDGRIIGASNQMKTLLLCLSVKIDMMGNAQYLV